ncbi:hypothetical protein ABW19_dt0205151 [Dactylella cylindrospora]|nr:hypothetical protein ABW19_dt0205151 [Dactylella cylindrospora]
MNLNTMMRSGIIRWTTVAATISSCCLAWPSIEWKPTRTHSELQTLTYQPRFVFITSSPGHDVEKRDHETAAVTVATNTSIHLERGNYSSVIGRTRNLTTLSSGRQSTGKKRKTKTTSRPTKSHSPLPTISADTLSPKNWELNCSTSSSPGPGTTIANVSTAVFNIQTGVTDQITIPNDTNCPRNWCDLESNVLTSICGPNAINVYLEGRNITIRVGLLQLGLKNLIGQDVKCNWDDPSEEFIYGSIQQASSKFYVAAEEWWIQVRHEPCDVWMDSHRDDTALSRPDQPYADEQQLWRIDVYEGIESNTTNEAATLEEINATKMKIEQGFILFNHSTLEPSLGEVLESDGNGYLRSPFREKDCFRFWCDTGNQVAIYLCDTLKIPNQDLRQTWGSAFVADGLDTLIRGINGDTSDVQISWKERALEDTAIITYRAILQETAVSSGTGSERFSGPELNVKKLATESGGSCKAWFMDKVYGEPDTPDSTSPPEFDYPALSGTVEKPDFLVEIANSVDIKACNTAPPPVYSNGTVGEYYCPKGRDGAYFTISQLDTLLGKTDPRTEEGQTWRLKDFEHQYYQTDPVNTTACYSFACEEQSQMLLSYCGERTPGVETFRDYPHHRLKALECCIKTGSNGKARPENCPATTCIWWVNGPPSLPRDVYYAKVTAYVEGNVTAQGSLWVNKNWDGNCEAYIKTWERNQTSTKEPYRFYFARGKTSIEALGANGF